MVMEELTIKINGMHDDFINETVASAIRSLDGVESSEFDAGIQLIKITIDPEKVSKKDIELAAYEAGFSVDFQ